MNTEAAIAREAHNLTKLENYTLTRVLEHFIKTGDRNSGLFAQYRFGVPIDMGFMPSKGGVDIDKIKDIKID